MPTKMIITLGEEATKKYLEIAREKVTEEIDENCEPSDMPISLFISANILYDSTAVCDGNELGEIQVDFINV